MRWSLASGNVLRSAPQEEETLSFIRDSLEKSDQLTKNMVSNPSAGRASRRWRENSATQGFGYLTPEASGLGGDGW